MRKPAATAPKATGRIRSVMKIERGVTLKRAPECGIVAVNAECTTAGVIPGLSLPITITSGAIMNSASFME
jgi:hypothetical protein